MTLPIDLGKTSVKGSSHIYVGMLVSTVLLAVGSIVIANMLGSDMYGLYSLSLYPINLLNLFVNFGVYAGIVRYSAQYKRYNESEKNRIIIASGLAFIFVSGSIVAASSFFLSQPIANYLNRSDASPLIGVYSLTILTESLITALLFAFVTLEKSQYYTVLLIFQAALRTGISVTLVVMGLGPLGAVIGYTAASLGTSILGMLILFFVTLKRTGSAFTELEIISNIKLLIRFGLPLYVRDLVKIGVGSHLLNLLMIVFSANVLIGNYKVALNFLTPLDFFLVSISIVLFPTFSKLDFQSDRETLKTVFVSSVKYTSLFIVPATAGLIALSEPIVYTLYKQAEYSLAPLYLSFGAVNFLYLAFGQASLSHLLSSQGETKKSMVLGLANAALAFGLAFFLIPRFQVLGLILSLVISGLPTIIIGAWWVKKLYNFAIDWKQSLKVIFSSFFAGIVTIAFLRYFSLSSLLGLALGFLVFSSVLFIASPLLRVVCLEDVSNLHVLLSGSMVVSKFLEIPLWLLSKSCRFADRARSLYHNRCNDSEEPAYIKKEL